MSRRPIASWGQESRPSTGTAGGLGQNRRIVAVRIRMKSALLARLMAAVLSLPLALPAHASGDTAEDNARAQAAALVAPLTLSADGLWRLHVDGHGVLHRVNLAEPSQQSQASLPTSVRRLSASRSGQKVAFATTTGCVGLTDF